MKRVAVFASGSGTNFQQICEYFNQKNNDIKIELLVVNKANAYVVERAKQLNVKSQYFNREDFYYSDRVVECLKENQIDFIVLAGFLWLIPDNILKEYPNKIINIHPALLPKYGGKGMHGHHVHEAVIAAKEQESGITIHYVNEKYDEGNIIFQAKCSITPEDTADSLAEKIHLLEKEHFPKVIDSLLS
ncbi:MAG: phosphoribosylglycinamide formyltransferase [Bacteroidales bacterium]|nr:phosphoribosylglycinamide formyltransferase [Bacteroidales bacterium]